MLRAPVDKVDTMMGSVSIEREVRKNQKEIVETKKKITIAGHQWLMPLILAT
jgi:hypothetical protein